MNKETWFKETVQGDTIAEVALKAGIIKTTAWRQYNNALGFSAENVILIARAYHKSPVEALVEFGYIRADEMTSGETVARLHDASNDELLQELARRLKENADADWVNSPIIYRDDFDMAERMWDGDTWHMAAELDVTMQVLTDYRQILKDGLFEKRP